MPEGWLDALLGDVAVLGAGNPAPQGNQFFNNGTYPFVRVQDMGRLGRDKYVVDTADHINRNAIKKMRLFPKGTVLFTKSGASSLLNQRAILKVDMYVVSHIATAIPCNGVLSDYLYYWLKMIDFNHIAHATTLPSIPLSKVRKIQISLPSSIEQEQIVNMLDGLLSDLDNAIDNLKKGKDQLKVYRQSVLKSAFEGYFSKDGLGREEWKELTVNEIGEVITGSTPSKQETKYYGRDYPLYKPGDLDAGFMTVDSVDGLTETGIKKARMLPAKSVLVTCIGATIGKTGLIRKAGACNQQINAIVPKNFMVSEYVYYYCISSQFQEQIKTNASATTLPILNKTKFQRLMFLVPTRSEQEKIVEEIESSFSLCDKMEETIENSLNRADALRQSILKQAFEGKLTKEWRKNHSELINGENSAKTLLEKIKAEREALENTKKRKK